MEAPLCKRCGENPRVKRYSGRKGFHEYCRTCKKKPYRMYKKDICEFCGFIPVHKTQLDVDHINGDHKDNRPENLQTLCANCHRLKTMVQQDHITGS